MRFVSSKASFTIVIPLLAFTLDSKSPRKPINPLSICNLSYSKDLYSFFYSLDNQNTVQNTVDL